MSLAYEFDWSVLAQPQFKELLLAGALYTVVIALVSTILSTILGTFIAAARLSNHFWLRLPANSWVALIRHIPGVFWVLFFYFAFPELLPVSWGEQLNGWAYFALCAGIVALTVDNSAYVSDIVRNGVMAIPREEREAATCCGLSTWQQWSCCLLPLTVRIVLPPLANRTIHNFKNSSLCMVIGVPELTWATQQIESLSFRGLETTLVASVFYIVIALGLGRWARQLEQRNSQGQRRSDSVWRNLRLPTRGVAT